MNTNELVEKVAKTNNLTKVQSRAIVGTVFETITKTVSKGQEVRVAGFGNFTKSYRKARVGRNPQTGASIQIPRKAVARFKPSSIFKQSL